MEITTINIQNLIDQLNRIKGVELTVSKLDVGGISKFEDHNLKIDNSIIDFYNSFSAIELYWDLEYSDTSIEILDFDNDIIMGDVRILAESFLKNLKHSGNQSLSNQMKETLMSMNIYETFIVVDHLTSNYVAGFIRKEDFIKDNVFLVKSMDSNLHNLDMSIATYLRYGYSAGFIKLWHELFLTTSKQENRLKRLGYYITKLFPAEINSFYMSKFKERFGEIDYQVD